MNFEEWYKTVWQWGSSTDRVRAERAWVMARVSVQPLVAALVQDRRNDAHLKEASEFLVEAGQFYQRHPELEPTPAME